MKKYKQLDLGQRYKIEALLKGGLSQSAIAEHLDVHRSTISRELRRNTSQSGRNAKKYIAQNAQSKALNREFYKNRSTRFTLEQLLYIREKLKEERWSPEQICQRGRIELGDFISHEWIYQYIWTAKFSHHRYYKEDKDLHKYLKHHGLRRKRRNQKGNRGCIPNRTGIEFRPEEASNRQRYGDYEVDFMMGKNRKPGLIVLTDRATLKTHLIKSGTKKAGVVSTKIIRRLLKEKSLLKTQTFDNDLGFADHERIAQKLDIETYFTRPYTAQDKGTVENRIGVIRRFLPKKTDIEKVHWSTIKAIENKINRRPVRKFKYLTPEEKFLSLVALDG